MNEERSRQYRFRQAMGYGYLYAACIGFPLFSAFTLYVAAFMNVQEGLAFMLVGAYGWWLSWRLSWSLKRPRFVWERKAQKCPQGP